MKVWQSLKLLDTCLKVCQRLTNIFSAVITALSKIGIKIDKAMMTDRLPKSTSFRLIMLARTPTVHNSESMEQLCLAREQKSDLHI